MDKINSLFTIGNVNEDNAQKIFADIATELFEHCFIKQGEAVKYKFLEVEFYFWSEAHKDNKLDNEGKKEVPFVRQGIFRNFLLHQKNPGVKLSYRIKNPCKTTQLPDLSFIFDLSSYFN